jgi:hypothetical protein
MFKVEIGLEAQSKSALSEGCLKVEKGRRTDKVVHSLCVCVSIHNLLAV